MKRTTWPIVVLCFLVMYLPACIPWKQKPQVFHAPLPEKAQPWSEELIDEKIAFFKNTIKQEDITDVDRRIALDLLDSYKSIKQVSPNQFKESEYRLLIGRLVNSLSLLDQEYFSHEQGRPLDYSSVISFFAKKRDDILNAYLSGDSKSVINSCLRLKALFGKDALTPEIAMLFALSLAKEGMVEDALNVGEVVEDELELTPDLILLRTKMAELQFIRGNHEKALTSYEKLTDVLDELRAIHDRLGQRISGAEKTTPDIKVLPSRVEPEAYPMDHKDWTTKQVLQKAARLAQDLRFSEARNLLLSRRGEISSGPLVEVFDQALQSLDQAEERYIEEKVSGILKRKETLKEARKLMDQEKFEEAISRIDAFSSTEEESRELAKLRDRAVGNLINRERNRAAKIFLAATKSQDLERKRKYLESSYDILHALFVKYPRSPLHDKLKSNLRRVEEELKKLGVEKGSSRD
ncbi:MAG: hypothetical protein V2J25_14855 [Desulfatiglans sp.]|nr:hypothetical protein [Desulfatiglans sp.]